MVNLVGDLGGFTRRHGLWASNACLRAATCSGYLCEHRGRESHADGTLVARVGGRHGRGAAAPRGRAAAPEHAGMEACMAASMFRQVVAPHEALVAQGAVEALLARVRAVVTRQLVGAGELFPAVWPRASKRALA